MAKDRDKAKMRQARYRASHGLEVLARHRKYNAANKARSHEYYVAHRDAVKQRMKAYYHEHKAEIAVKTREYYSRERTKKGRAAWRQVNAGKIAAWSKLHRARKMLAPVNDLTDEQWDERVVEFRGRCAYCLNPMATVTQDHLIPLSRGGSHTLSNVVPCCKSCNSKKHARTLLEYVMVTQGNFV